MREDCRAFALLCVPWRCTWYCEWLLLGWLIVRVMIEFAVREDSHSMRCNIANTKS